MSKPRIAIFNDTHGWHSEQLTRSLDAIGLKAVQCDLALCRIDLNSTTGLKIPGFEHNLPDAVLVRGIAPGSLEQITFRMDVLHTLAELGVPVLNPAKAIELTVDKARTSMRLHLAGIKTPFTWACEDRQQAIEIIGQQLAQNQQVVMKPLFGCQGKGIILITVLEQLEMIHPLGETFYLQQYIPPETEGIWQDWRLMVIEDKVVAAMSRRSKNWITNFAQGGSCFAAPVTDEMQKLALAASRAVEAPYAGVDLIQDQQGQFNVLEVNSVPAWKGLYQATGIDVSGQIAALVKRHIRHSQINQFSENVI